MGSVKPLGPAALRRRCDPTQFTFETTAELEALEEIIGQPRAVEAVRFGIGIRRHGYNLFALGPPGTGRHSLVQRFLEQKASAEPTPSDVCYINNFVEPHRPRALRLLFGLGVKLRRDMQRLVEKLRSAIAGAFEIEHTGHGGRR